VRASPSALPHPVPEHKDGTAVGTARRKAGCAACRRWPLAARRGGGSKEDPRRLLLEWARPAGAPRSALSRRSAVVRSRVGFHGRPCICMPTMGMRGFGELGKGLRCTCCSRRLEEPGSGIDTRLTISDKCAKVDGRVTIEKTKLGKKGRGGEVKMGQICVLRA
jgi:hypothetical protein